MLKRVVKKKVRDFLKAKKNETVNDALNRNIVKIQKKIFKKKYRIPDLKNALIELGVSSGDNIFLHSSWRQFYNFEGNPDDVIKLIREIISDQGTLLMPSYGSDGTFFDVINTPSSAGVLTEVFRKLPNTKRSACTHFSVCAQGPHAEDLTKDHLKSEYGFDKFSPCYKFTQLNKTKILFMGLGKIPTKISLFHCAGYNLKMTNPFLKDIFSHQYKTTLIIKGIKYEKNMITRKPGHGNNNNTFRKIFKAINNKNAKKISNLDLVVIDAQEGLQKAIEFANKGFYCYK